MLAHQYDSDPRREFAKCPAVRIHMVPGSVVCKSSLMATAQPSLQGISQVIGAYIPHDLGHLVAPVAVNKFKFTGTARASLAK